MTLRLLAKSISQLQGFILGYESYFPRVSVYFYHFAIYQFYIKNPLSF